MCTIGLVADKNIKNDANFHLSKVTLKPRKCPITLCISGIFAEIDIIATGIMYIYNLRFGQLRLAIGNAIPISNKTSDYLQVLTCYTPEIKIL